MGGVGAQGFTRIQFNQHILQQKKNHPVAHVLKKTQNPSAYNRFYTVYSSIDNINVLTIFLKSFDINIFCIICQKIKLKSL